MASHSSNMLGLAQRGFQMDDFNKHLSYFLRENGYHTCLFGAQHEEPDTAMLGYDYYYEADCDESDFMSRDNGACSHAADYLRNYHEDKPLFMSVGFIHTHRLTEAILKTRKIISIPTMSHRHLLSQLQRKTEKTWLPKCGQRRSQMTASELH